LLQRILLVLVGILAVALVVGLVAGRGDDGEETTATATGKKRVAGVSEEVTECEKMGISSPPREEGTCDADGIRWVVVNRDGLLKLPTLEAEMLDLRETRTITDESGGSATAKGTYVIVELSITNHTDAPERFEDSQIVLLAGGPYTADAKVQSTVERKSFLGQDTPIQPGDSQVGTVVFDLPSSAFKALDTEGEGNLNIVNFGSRGEIFEQGEIGVIRTYQ
jgi:Domain of unknown function (DUF4352)